MGRLPSLQQGQVPHETALQSSSGPARRCSRTPQGISGQILS